MTRTKLLALVAVLEACATKTIQLENPSDVDGDGYTVEQGDCNDDDPLVGPAVVEACNGYDDNCDGVVDEINRDNAVVSYADTDEDGYGDPTVGSAACEIPAGYVEDNTDCDDNNSYINPSAVEVCDNADNNCDGVVDESAAVDAQVSYVDSDGDGFGSSGVMMTSCSVLDGFVEDSSDCDDNNSSINPSAVEVCDNADNNCNGAVDEAGAVGEATWYADRDQDGFGDASLLETDCEAPTGYVEDSSDCDDNNSSINPSAVEVCDNADNNCNGAVDEAGAVGEATWYADSDSDGYGDLVNTLTTCDSPSNYVADFTDCDDTNNSIHPGATEACDEVDNNCDGAVDESGATGSTTWYEDADADGFGGSRTATECDQPSGFVSTSTDCDDAEGEINPDATEQCDGVDNNCDGEVDEDTAEDAVVWYADADGDGYGNVDSYTFACTEPSGYVAGTGDADDSDASVRWSACQQAFITSDSNWENYLWPGEYTDLVLTMSTNTSTTYGYVYWWDPDDSSQFWIACGSVDSSLETDLTVPDLDGYYGSAFDAVGVWHPEYVVDAVREDGFYFQNTGTEVSAAMYLELIP